VLAILSRILAESGDPDEMLSPWRCEHAGKSISEHVAMPCRSGNEIGPSSSAPEYDIQSLKVGR
jgi:hypothetical protein